MHVFYSPFPIYTSKYWPSWKRWKRNHFKRKLNDTFDWKYFFLYSTILNSFVKRNLFFLSYWLSIWILGVWCAMLWWCLPFVPLGCIQSIFFIFLIISQSSSHLPPQLSFATTLCWQWRWCCCYATAFTHGDVIVPVTASHGGHWGPIVGKFRCFSSSFLFRFF